VNFKDIWAMLHSKDLYTWIGHGILGLSLGFLFGWVFVAGWFVGHEVTDLAKWVFEDKETRRPLQAMAKDGFFDLWAPMLGASIAEIVKAL
jgi:hypothetical protein